MPVIVIVGLKFGVVHAHRGGRGVRGLRLPGFDACPIASSHTATSGRVSRGGDDDRRCDAARRHGDAGGDGHQPSCRHRAVGRRACRPAGDEPDPADGGDWWSPGSSAPRWTSVRRHADPRPDPDAGSAGYAPASTRSTSACCSSCINAIGLISPPVASVLNGCRRCLAHRHDRGHQGRGLLRVRVPAALKRMTPLPWLSPCRPPISRAERAL